MSVEENKAVMQRIWKELINEGKTEEMNELIASDYALHASGGYEKRGTEGLKEFIGWLHRSVPDVHFTVDDVIAEGDKVVSFYTVKGTHKSNKPLYSQGVIISRFASGKEVETWDIYDRFTLALQLAPGLAKAMLRFVEKQMVKDRP
jgi:predicted SnoaL-like aldol condensation-catalyzing enzyme